MRGLIVGVVAGLLSFTIAKVFGEPAVDRAIAFEAAEAKARGEVPDREIVSRQVQASVGLLTGVVVYGAALGGLFALAFAVCYGRFTTLSPKVCAAVLGLLGFVAVYGVPFLKYPANPPAVGEPATIAARTGLYFSMIAVSLIAMMAATSFKRLAERRLGRWNATLTGAIAFIVLVGIAAALLPAVNEVPAEFPAVTLWQFRLVSFGMQAVLWTAIAVLFGILTERNLARRG